MRTKKYIEQTQLVDYRFNRENNTSMAIGSASINKLLDKGWKIKHVNTICDNVINYVVYKYI